MSLGWVGVHSEPRRGVDLANASTYVFERLGDVLGEEVDAGYVQTDGLGGPFGHVFVVGMHNVGDVQSSAAG